MKLTVSNFQIHQKPKTVEIPEGETTYLEGDSDIGKSALIRAMRWLGENKPDGGSFVTFKQPRGTTSVVTLEADGRSVTRERGKSKNLYKLDEEIFEAFGRNVPEPIAKFLNLSPYAFQCQGEVPFLIGASPTEAAKILSDACGLGVIDTAVQFVRGKKTAVEAEIRKSEILLESAQQRLSQATESLPLADALEAAARMGDDVEELSENVDLLTDAIDNEPQGELLNMTGARTAETNALAAWDAMLDLTGKAGRLRCCIQDEPSGEMRNIEAVTILANRLYQLDDDHTKLVDRFVLIRHAIDKECPAPLIDVSAIFPVAGTARILGEWIADVSKSAERMRQRLRDEPGGNIQGTVHVLPIVERARAAGSEVGLLDQMYWKMRGVLETEPQGAFLDTTELQQQRAQIKVCPTCGREL